MYICQNTTTHLKFFTDVYKITNTCIKLLVIFYCFHVIMKVLTVFSHKDFLSTYVINTNFLSTIYGTQVVCG